MPGQLQLARAIPSRPGSPVGPEQRRNAIENAMWREENAMGRENAIENAMWREERCGGRLEKERYMKRGERDGERERYTKRET